MEGSELLSQTKTLSDKSFNTSAKLFLQSLLQVEDENMSVSKRNQITKVLSEIVIQSEIVIDHIKLANNYNN